MTGAVVSAAACRLFAPSPDPPSLGMSHPEGVTPGPEDDMDPGGDTGPPAKAVGDGAEEKEDSNGPSRAKEVRVTRESGLL